ncbi:HamA C-terminal domain-containing protein [Streptococcus pluranimalium]|uniref:HamA C-terminal domain-containing protein n=1 Tax=Streptococcus pluranimalium TaxID=82348 RepID=UPI003F692DCC
MRQQLEDLIKNSLVIKYKLPTNFINNAGVEEAIKISDLTTPGKGEYCLEGSDNDISKIIYNGIIEFAVNEFKINYQNLNLEQRRVIKSKIRYNENSSQAEKLKYGFYGEVLLDLLLRTYFGTNVLLARGYFYSPLENSEVKGFDAFHLVENNNHLQLWFGEAKFYQSFYSAINSVIKKLNSSLSNSYLEKHMIAIINEKFNISNSNGILDTLINTWEQDPDIILVDELTKYRVELVYPIFVAYQKSSSQSYEASIIDCIDKINTTLKKFPYSQSLNINLSIFVMVLPVKNSNQIKEEVIEWIETREPLI